MLMPYKKTLTISLLLLNCFLSGCTLLSKTEEYKPEANSSTQTSARTEIFNNAEKFFQNNDYISAKPLYIRLSRYKEGTHDISYDLALWRLTKIYENENEIEKALLTLDEMLSFRKNTIPKNRIKFTQMRYHFLLTNYNQAKEIKKDIDEAYKNNSITLKELYEYINETTQSINASYLIEELMFLGEAQKYFVFIMESQLNPENQLATDRLIQNYDYFFSLLNNVSISGAFKKKLSIALYDQLTKFNQYKIDLIKSENSDSSHNSTSVFYDYSVKKLKILTEGFYK